MPVSIPVLLLFALRGTLAKQLTVISLRGWDRSLASWRLRSDMDVYNLRSSSIVYKKSNHGGP